jgi:tetratricopeptide (TPR) repeat protein
MIRTTLYILCLLLSTAGYSQTQISYTTTTAVNSDSAQFFLQKGLEEKEKGRRLESLKNFEKASKYDSNNKAIVAELAAAYFDLRKHYLATESYKKLVSMGDASALTYKRLLDLSFNMKQADDVILYAGKLKAVDPSEKVGYYIGKTSYDQENYGEAIKHLTIAAKEQPENAEIPYLIARSYADMMNFKLAIPHFRKAIELDPSKNHWIYELGLIYYAMNDNKHALEYILLAGEKGYKKTNDYITNLAVAYINVGKVDESITLLEDILQKRPSDLNILDMLAESYYAKGKYQQAIDHWDQILVVDNKNASALYMIGMSYQKKGEKEKGVQLCDKAIQMDPSLSSLKQKKMMMGM